MITKETARQIYNCYSQMEAIDNLKKEMLDEILRIREKRKEAKKSFEEPIPEKDGYFGRFGRGCQLGVPNGSSSLSSMRIFNISPELAISVMDEQKEVLIRKMRDLEAIANLEMSNKKTKIFDFEQQKKDAENEC